LKFSRKNLDGALKAHLSDFPQAEIPEYAALE
jgi:hypothetical protein